MSRSIVIANQKGGVGKTTTAVNLAASLAVMEKKVLVIDCDPQANASSGLGVSAEEGKSLYDVFYAPQDAQNAVMATDLPCLWVLPSSPDFVAIELELVDKTDREGYLRKVVDALDDAYDYIIIDCPPSLGLTTLNALCAARELLIPLQCEYYALEGLAQIMRTYDLVRRRLNQDLNLMGVLLTMYDGRNNLASQVVAEVREHFGDKAFGTLIPRNIRLSEAPSHGKPVITYDVKSRGAQAYLELAQEVEGRAASTPQA